ncbi:hypothetical protein PHYPO_G00098990 [Pangasianodon hypophthalmus]|uniref:Uncharacterized protein n=1 Tax=Pangasianodon hypophthalmus TaxID=310915 RepID=A0A5N5LBU9_PANHP|nr:hypothetical protein PHYPO_G00098990 [Pangasianodon hypophthalmus]
MPSQRKKRQRRMRRLQGQWRVLEDQNVITGKRNSGVCGVSAPILKQPKKTQLKAQAKVPVSEPEVTSVPELLTPQATKHKVIETTEVEAATEVHVSETEDMMTPPKMEAVPEVMPVPEIEAAQEISTSEVKKEPEFMITVSELTTPKETLEVSSPEVSVAEIEAQVMEAPKVPLLEAPDVTTPKMEAFTEVMEVQEVTAIRETLVSPEPELMVMLEGIPEPEVILTPEMEAQETTADIPAVLCEVPMNVPSEEPAVQENIISTA